MAAGEQNCVRAFGHSVQMLNFCWQTLQKPSTMKGQVLLCSNDKSASGFAAGDHALIAVGHLGLWHVSRVGFVFHSARSICCIVV
jgi:hypothetical protein